MKKIMKASFFRYGAGLFMSLLFMLSLDAKAATKSPAKGIETLAQPQTFNIQAETSQLQFVANSFLANVKGRFDYWTGVITYDAKNPLASEVKIKIDAKSINTENRSRDKHLRDEDFFWAEKYPDIVFESTSLSPIENQPDHFEVKGNLTLRGVTKEVSFPARIHLKDGVIRSKAFLRILRRDFGMDYKAYMNPIKNEVEIQYEITAKPPSTSASGQESR